MGKARPGERRQQILQTLARMLEEQHGERVTTAALAQAVGVSEAALYRHFHSKEGMLAALIEFIEESLFTRITRILAEEPNPLRRLHDIVYLVLAFADKNPGMARLLYGDILTGETARLRRRVAQIYDRLETQLKQILRESELAGGPVRPAVDIAAVLAAFIGGRIAQFVRGEYATSPIAGWDRQWALIERALDVGQQSAADQDTSPQR